MAEAEAGAEEQAAWPGPGPGAHPPGAWGLTGPGSASAGSACPPVLGGGDMQASREWPQVPSLCRVEPWGPSRKGPQEGPEEAAAAAGSDAVTGKGSRWSNTGCPQNVPTP